MKIFISWSGNQSLCVAKELKDWLFCVLQKVDTFLSAEDIRKGQRWNLEVAKELDGCDYGIVCLTKTNLSSPWILFEAGALSKSLDDSNVSAILIGNLKASDIVGPLSQFQHTTATKIDIWKLVSDVNEKLNSEKLPKSLLEKTFEKWWPDLEDKLQSINSQEDEAQVQERSDREILNEVLDLSRFLANRSINPVDFNKWYRTQTPQKSSFQIDADDILLSPTGGEFNHPSKVVVYPVSLYKDGKEELVSVSISNGEIDIQETAPPEFSRGVVIIMQFLSETDSQKWEAKFSFHKGNTFVETKMLDDANLNDVLSDEIVIWRD